MAVFADPFGAMVEGRRQREQDDQRYIDLVRRIEADIAMDQFRGASLEAQRENNRAMRARDDARLAEQRRQFDATFGQRGTEFNTEMEMRRRNLDILDRRYTPLPAANPGDVAAPGARPRPPRRDAPAPGAGTGLPDVLNAAPPPMEVSPALRRGAMGSPFVPPPMAPTDPVVPLPVPGAGADNPFPPAPPGPRSFNSDGTPYEGFSFRNWWGGR